MKLQISFDLIDLKKSLKIAQKVAEFADILEVGSILIYRYGIEAVKEFCKAFPNSTILADTKIVDHGREIVNLLEKNGPKWITIMAGANKKIIQSACSAAHDANKKSVLDLLTTDFIGQSAMEAKILGVDSILFHKVYTQDSALTFKDKWEMVKGNTSLPIFISAQIDENNIDNIIEFRPSGIVVGKAITVSDNPKKSAQFFKEKCI